jgi:hypothetical protein
LFDKLKKTVEESKEEFEDLVSELDSTKSGLDDLESKLEDINKQIEEISENSPLSFTDEEDLKRLKEESAELEKQIEFKKMIAEQQQGKVNQEAVKQVDKYKQTVGDSGKTRKEIIGDSTKTGAGIGLAAGLTTIGAAVGGAIKGAASGVVAGIPGVVIGAIVGLLAGAAVGAGVGSIQAAAEGNTVGSTLENMDENYTNLENKMVDARDKALETGKEKDQKAHEEAQKNAVSLVGGTHYSTEKYAVMEMVKFFENLGLECEFLPETPNFEEL